MCWRAAVRVMRKLELRAEARDDLDDILDYSVEMFGATVAEDYVAGFGEAFGLLLDHPRMGMELPEYPTAIRVLSHRSHRIYYELVDDTVIIARILHKARDARRLLN